MIALSNNTCFTNRYSAAVVRGVTTPLESEGALTPMRAVTVSLLLAVALVVAFAALPASLGMISLLRMLLFLGIAACLVGVVLRSATWLVRHESAGRTTRLARALH